MPAVSILMIRLSLVWLMVGSFLGSAMMLGKVFAWPVVWILLPAHMESAIVGWLAQFLIGTAYWMFPRHLESAGRGNPAPAWMMALLLNAGIISVIAAPWAGVELLTTAGRLMIFVATLLFIYLMWSRVVSYRDRE